MAKTVAAWERLLALGLAQDRRSAEALILAGKVRIADRLVASAGQRIETEAEVRIKGADLPYVSKGGLKLAGALQDFDLSPQGLVCMDAGASTGGFTDCLVQHGAELVYAVDVGFGQLAGSLRSHPRVRNLERTNLGDERLLSLAPRPCFASVDLSYLSLRKAVPLFARILGVGTLLCLVKPLFELEDMAARRSGQVPDAALAPMLMDLRDALEDQGHGVLGVTNSPVTGNHGTREFFLHVALGEAGRTPRLPEAEFDRAVERARQLAPYQK